MAMTQLWLEADGTIGTSTLGELRLGAVVGASVVPSQADDDRVA